MRRMDESALGSLECTIMHPNVYSRDADVETRSCRLVCIQRTFYCAPAGMSCGYTDMVRDWPLGLSSLGCV